MLLRKDDPWPETADIPDVRDWRVVNADGELVGFVQTVIFDREAGSCEAVMTGPNDRFRIDQLEVDEGVVRLKQPVRRRDASRPRTDASVMEGTRGSFEAAFRKHFAESYADEQVEFDWLLPAYIFGRILALDADYAGRSFAAAEEDVRAEYVARGGMPAYQDAREAVRFGYEITRSARVDGSGGMEREWDQITSPGQRGTGAFVRAGASMDTSSPAAEDKSVLDNT